MSFLPAYMLLIWISNYFTKIIQKFASKIVFAYILASTWTRGVGGRSSETDLGFGTIGSKNGGIPNISKIGLNTKPVGGG